MFPDKNLFNWSVFSKELNGLAGFTAMFDFYSWALDSCSLADEKNDAFYERMIFSLLFSLTFYLFDAFLCLTS